MIDRLRFPSLSEEPLCLSSPCLPRTHISHSSVTRTTFEFFSAVKYEGNFYSPTFHTVCLKRLPRTDRGIKFLNKLAFECYVKFLLCCLCALNRVLSRLPVSSVDQRSNTYGLQQMREFSASVEHVGVGSYCIFILSL